MNPDIAWRVIVKTANATQAGISATVFLKIHGERGSVRPIELGDRASKAKAGRSPFSRNCTSQFLAKREDVGAIKSIEIWHNDETDWNCEFIEIQRGNDSWKFRPKERIPSQQSQEEPTPTRLIGEYAQVSNGATAFHNAARDGDIATLQRFLSSEEYTVDTTDKLGRTAAQYAVLYGQKDALDLLIEKKADITHRDKSGKTCLHHACLNHVNNVDIINRSLLKHAQRGGVYANDNDEEEEDADPVTRYIRERDMFGKTAMHYASTYGFVPVVQLLDSKCRIALRDQDNTQQTPLHCAAIQGEVKAALCLIDLGAQVETKDKHEKTFVHHAATAGHHEFIATVMSYDFDEQTKQELQSLLEAVDVSGRTPLLCAAADGGLATVKVLYQLKSDIHHVDSDKSTALHHAAKRGDEALLSYLQQKLDVNLKNVYDYTPLHVAVTNNNNKAVRWLLKHGADITAKTVSGDSAATLSSHATDESMQRVVQNAMRVAKEEAAARGGDIAGDGDLADAAGDLTTAPTANIHAADEDDELPFFDEDMTGGAGGAGGKKSLLDEISALKAEIAALKEKVKKKNRIIELLKQKFGLGGVDVEEEIAAGRMCKDPAECSVM